MCMLCEEFWSDSVISQDESGILLGCLDVVGDSLNPQCVITNKKSLGDLPSVS